MEFFNSAVGVLQTLVVALGAGLGIWALSTFWKVTARTTLLPMLMYGKEARDFFPMFLPLFPIFLLFWFLPYIWLYMYY